MNQENNESLQLIILGAGKPFFGQQHSSLRFSHGNLRVLDWLIRSMPSTASSPYFVSGYQAEKIRKYYPEFTFFHNDEWQSTNSAWSLLLALPDSNAEFVASYADILFRQSAAHQLLKVKGDVIIAVDSYWQKRYIGRPEADLERCEKVCLLDNLVTRLGANIPIELASAEFVGLTRFSVRALESLRVIAKTRSDKANFLRKANLSDLIELLRTQGLQVVSLDVQGDWAELNEAADLARFILGTKAQTLRHLNGMIMLARIEEQVSFTVDAWQANATSWIKAIQQLNCSKVIVRSSAFSEDGFHNSNAGAYSSILNVDAKQTDALRDAVEVVIASYLDANSENEVLVQPMLDNVVASGVVFTRSLTNGAPYYVINYDDKSGSTESITNGSSKEHKTLLIRRDSASSCTTILPPLSGLLPALIEIESLLGYDSLDVEFAVTNQGLVHILQVRPIALQLSSRGVEDSHVYDLLAQAEARFEALQQPSPFVQGERTIFGVMPDWNPAEIIGTKPCQLAISLYRNLIMDSVWAAQRAERGYRDVRPQPLLQLFAGHPYVDVRASLNSFIPAELPDQLAKRIVEFCLNWLQANPHLHDKLEFEVIPTCFGLDFDRWQQRFVSDAGLSVAEVMQWRNALLKVSSNALELNAVDMKSIQRLEQRYEMLMNSDLPPLSKALALLEDVRLYGTPAFANLARSAFIAVTLLRSAVTKGVLSQLEVNDFLSTISSVSHAYIHDANSCAHGEITWTAFVERYSHLRPGTFDITSSSYGQDPERYLRPTIRRALLAPEQQGVQSTTGKLWGAARERFVQALNEAGIVENIEKVECFLRQAIEGREYSKFAFTRNLSSALDAIRDWGAENGVYAEVLQHIGIDDLCALNTGQVTTTNTTSLLKQLASNAAKQRSVIEAVELPPLLCNITDFKVFQYPATQANYIGSTIIRAKCLDIVNADPKAELSGFIVMIPQADPGYDWLFGRGILGLVTLYGGANSHMAIRAAEFGLTAVIGLGEVKYRALIAAHEIEIDPIKRIIRALN